MSDHAAVHDHGWDTSVWPLVLSVSVLFLCLSFTFFAAWGLPMYSIVCLGIAVPLLVAGIIGWTSETIGVEGPALSFGAMGWFILAEALIFLSLFASYWYARLAAPEWPPAGTPEMPVLLPAIMTVVLVTSSFTIHIGEAKLEEGDRGGFVKWLFITMILGLAFLGMSGYEWTHLFAHHFTAATNIYGSAFFGTTGFHGAHVLIGICIFLTMLIPAMRGTVNNMFVKTGSLYWHFVDIIWLFVVSQLYYW